MTSKALPSARRRDLLRQAAGVAAAALAQRAAAAPSDTMLSMGLIPYLSTRALVSVFEPLRLHLQRRLGRRVVTYTAVDHPAFAQALREGGYDFAFMPAHTMRLAAQDWGYVPLARTRAPTRIVLVVRKDRAVHAPDDLRGGRVVLLDRIAITSMATLDWLEERGVQPGRDVAVEYLINISSVLLMLDRPEVAAVALIESTLHDFPAEERAKVRVLAVVRSVPSPGFAARKSLAPELRDALRDGLLSFTGTADGAGSISRSPLEPVELSDLDPLEPYTQRLRRALARS